MFKIPHIIARMLSFDSYLAFLGKKTQFTQNLTAVSIQYTFAAGLFAVGTPI